MGAGKEHRDCVILGLATERAGAARVAQADRPGLVFSIYYLSVRKNAHVLFHFIPVNFSASRGHIRQDKPSNLMIA